MTEREMKQVFSVMQTIYPSSELFLGNLAERVKIWAGFFKDVDLMRMKTALASYVTRNKYAPTISDMMDALKTDTSSKINPGSEWDTLLSLAERINDYRAEFGYTYIPEGAQLSQGAQAREDARYLYESAPGYIRQYVGGFPSMLRFCQEIDRLDSTGLSIKRRDYEQWRRQNVAYSTAAELEESLLVEGTTRRVIGYNHYTPIFEGSDGQ